MHRIYIDPATRFFLTSRVVAPADYPRRPMRVRLRLSTEIVQSGAHVFLQHMRALPVALTRPGAVECALQPR